MDVVDAIKERKSYRAFKSDPVPLDMVRKIMEQALRAPSWANTQPWEFAVATGEKLEEIEEGFVKKGVQEAYNEVARP
ncbi:MAG: nitroreductase family protein, partial [Dehalococcoidales bacterium]|nr:nitroreductase family protein [Dehalococcoidales bacterium]